MIRNSTIAFLTTLSSLMSFAQTPCVGGFADGFRCDNVTLMSHLSLDDVGGAQNGNDCWGWTSPQGKEIAIYCKSNGTSFVDITDPVNPIYLGDLPSHTSPSLWRDAKVYNDHAFIVSEAGEHGMQVISLTQMDNVVNPPVSFTETAFYGAFGNAHNIAINEESGFAYAVGTNTFNGGLHIVNIQDPTQPILEGGYAEDGYTHDTQVVIYHGPDVEHTGKEIAFSSNEDYVTITDVTDKTDCEMISTETYENAAYIHQGWLTEDHRYFLQNDEIDESTFFFATRTHLWDMIDLENPVYIGYHESPEITSDHNLYTKGNLAFMANYLSGLRIVDISNLGNGPLEEVGFFDTSQGLNYPGYSGSWSVYPYFESGNVIVSNMDNGLFILRPDEEVLNLDHSVIEPLKLNAYPNPAKNILNITWSQNIDSAIKLMNLTGQVVAEFPTMGLNGKFSLDISKIPSGIYILMSTDLTISSQRIIIE